MKKSTQVRSINRLEGYLPLAFISFIFVQIIQIKNNLGTIKETVLFLQEIIQIKVNNVLYIINLSKKVMSSKRKNDVTNPVATTFVVGYVLNSIEFPRFFYA